MMIMPANNTGFVVGYLAGKHPGKVGLLISPGGWRVPQFKLPYALDNGCFVKWDEKAFFKLLGRAQLVHKPLWVCVPDVVADAEKTLKMWDQYYLKILNMGFNLAFVAQDGMVPGDVPKNASAVFIGGSTDWKLNNAHKFKGKTSWLHIGRVNTGSRLRWAESIGADSVDGTGFFRAKGKQYIDFLEWFEGDPQMNLKFTQIQPKKVQHVISADASKLRRSLK